MAVTDDLIDPCHMSMWSSGFGIRESVSGFTRQGLAAATVSWRAHHKLAAKVIIVSMQDLSKAGLSAMTSELGLDGLSVSRIGGTISEEPCRPVASHLEHGCVRHGAQG